MRPARLQGIHEDLQIVIHNVGGGSRAAQSEVTGRLHAQQRRFLHGHNIRQAGGDPIRHGLEAKGRLRGEKLVVDARHGGNQVHQVVRIRRIQCRDGFRSGADVQVGGHRFEIAFAVGALFTRLGREGRREQGDHEEQEARGGYKRPGACTEHPRPC